MAKYKRNITLEFLVGLPGSGKTTFAKKQEAKNRALTRAIHFDTEFDTCWWKTGKEYDKENIIRNNVLNAINGNRVNKLILDGLFLTQDDILRVIKAVNKLFSNTDVVIHQWKEDREACLKNDGGRRDASSSATILNAKYEQIDGAKLQEAIREICDWVNVVRVVKHDVVLKPDWERYFRGKTYVWEDGKMRSDKWCTGGSYGSYWGDKLSPVSPDEQPEFEALDELLTNICPNITFLQYKKIMRNCVEITEEYDSDYYGGGCTYNRYVCDIQKLYDCLTQFGYT